MARKFFSGNTVEQALLSAARAFTVDPGEIAYSVRDKKHGFIKIRRKVVIEVDPEAPVKSVSSSSPSSTGAESVGAGEAKAAEANPSYEPEREGSRRRPGGASATSEDATEASFTGGGSSSANRERAETGSSQDRSFEKRLEDEDLDREGSSARGSSSRGTEARGTEETEDVPTGNDRSESPGQSRPAKGGQFVPREQSSSRGQSSSRESSSRSRGGRRESVEQAPVQISRELVDAEEAIDIALDELSHFLCVDVSWEIEKTEDGFEVELEGPDQEWLLDDDGSLLLAIEHLLPRMVRSLSGESAHCSVDCDGFHSSHESHLCEMAARAAEEAIRSGRPQMLEPMAPADRRVVHLHLVDDPTVGTQSKGNGLFKRVKIFPVRPS